jgi:hypothetical protein
VTILGGWALIRPNVSVEPYIPLNPVDPYSTQLIVKNENGVFEAHDINCVCWPRQMQSGNWFQRAQHWGPSQPASSNKNLPPGASSTIDCPSVIGGVGTYSGQVLYADLEIEVSFWGSWWPFTRNERYPFVCLNARCAGCCAFDTHHPRYGETDWAAETLAAR